MITKDCSNVHGSLTKRTASHGMKRQHEKTGDAQNNEILVCLFARFCLLYQYLQTFSHSPFVEIRTWHSYKNNDKGFPLFVHPPAWFTCMLAEGFLKEKPSKGEAGRVVLLFSRRERGNSSLGSSVRCLYTGSVVSSLGIDFGWFSLLRFRVF